jgi:hypothetical protein
MHRRLRPIRSSAILRWPYDTRWPEFHPFRHEIFTLVQALPLQCELRPWTSCRAREAASVLRLRACSIPTFVRTRFRAAQVEWHLAIVHSLLVARLAAEPLLTGADWLDMTRFALGTRCRTWRCQRRQQEKYPRHGANRRRQPHPKRMGHRRVFSQRQTGLHALRRRVIWAGLAPPTSGGRQSSSRCRPSHT